MSGTFGHANAFDLMVQCSIKLTTPFLMTEHQQLLQCYNVVHVVIVIVYGNKLWLRWKAVLLERRWIRTWRLKWGRTLVMFLCHLQGRWTWQWATFSCLSSTLHKSLLSTTSRVKDRKRGTGSSSSSSWDVHRHSSFRWSVGSSGWCVVSMISKESLQSGYQLLNSTSYS